MARVIEMICPTGRAEYFCAKDWTVKSALIWLEKFDFWRNDLLVGSHPFRHSGAPEGRARNP
jgi:hypothetical protein